MTLTTAGPAGAGVYWQAVVLTEFGLVLEPDIQMYKVPSAGFNITLTPALGMRGPQSVVLHLSPLITMTAGTKKNASFTLEFTPQIGMSRVFDAAFELHATPSIGMVGTVIHPALHGGQVNVSVQRASTF